MGHFLLTVLILDTKQIMQITFGKYRTFQAVSLIVFLYIKLFTAFFFHFVVGTKRLSVLVQAKMHLHSRHVRSELLVQCKIAK